ncbi:MFS transporter [Anaerosporobacter faecicola]|uniref:MFS transporter n=1 Tax=Anaerosporobacter faecicola TaxID=2718714 RepID=UPI001439693E|nr:MFS transporter [Anaerosporobacter faecicola]
MKKRQQVIIYSALHFVVDFTCALLLLCCVGKSSDWKVAFLLYNFCAFAMQMPIGVLADGKGGKTQFAALGCILVPLAYVFRREPILLGIIAGLGNGFFHVGAGVSVIAMSREKASALGIFVSPGAFGIYFGALLGNKGSIPMVPVLAIVSMMGVGLAILVRQWNKDIIREETRKENCTKGVSEKSRKEYCIKENGINQIGLLCVLLVGIFVVVVLRSYAGMHFDFPWKRQGGQLTGMAHVSMVVFGKMAGGILMDWLGVRKSVISSLGLACICFPLSNIPIFGYLGVFLFNMSMPITLWFCAQILWSKKGFAFGFLTFGLFIGFLPSYLGITIGPEGRVAYFIWTFLSLGILLLATKFYTNGCGKQGERNEKVVRNQKAEMSSKW